MAPRQFNPPASNITVPVVNGARNWDQWYNTILGMCEMADIDSILKGELTESETTYWQTANKYITGIIRSSLKSGGLTHVSKHTSAYEMILALKGAYKVKGYTSREVLWRTLTRTNSSDYKSIIEWVKTMKRTTTALQKVTPPKQALPTWIVVTTLLHGLPSSYDSFVEITLSSRGKNAEGSLLEPDFDEVVDKVLDKERRQRMEEENFKALKVFTLSNDSRPKNNRSLSYDERKQCGECGGTHGPPCFLAHPEKAYQRWRDANKEKIVDFKKKKAEEKKERRRRRRPAVL